ncbi:aldehyde dehydrogenase family protein [Nocardioides caldifontis]|uniref:aldehyde dehydrogenase family protein n=1 Tax=Nocardioides caldifontis TaxID=2588938 RepID=UPI0011DFE7B8|nr:aldehyde dehydrogenase family protein [Nocardioides caldifontis]
MVKLLDPVASFVNREHGVFIGGEFVDSRGADRIPVTDPYSGQVLTTVPSGVSADIDAAVAAATQALPAWRKMPTATRAELLWRLGARIEELADEFAQLDALDNGKPVSEALAVDVPLSAGLYKYYAGWASKLEGRTITPQGGASMHVYTRRESVGVVGAIIPWNFPLLMCGYKLGPALATGNTVVLKPAEQTPLSALRLAEVINEVGFPPGVVNIVTGYGPTAGAPLAAHPGVDKITFTGETSTGQKIMQAAQGNMKKVTLELGGKSPSVVFADADLDAALEGTFGAVFFNQGQCCIAGARVYVEDSIADEFTARLVDRVGQVRLGSGLDPETTMGPLVSEEQQERVNSMIRSGIDEGATIASDPDTPLPGQGSFVRPTVFTDVKPDMRIMREEIFGPVAMVARFKTEEEAVILANDTSYGLCSGVWTKDIARAHRMAAGIHAGTVYVNTYGYFDPAVSFGGFKMSGFGKELGEEALDSYLQTKTVWVNLD